MSQAHIAHALRTGAVGSLRSAAVTRVRGTGAWEAVERLSARPLFVRDGGSLSTLWLNADATIRADLQVLVDGSDLILLTEGATSMEVADALTETDVDVEAGVVFGCDGPYAWELLTHLVGEGVLGVPWHGTFTLGDGALGRRAGSTGEWGYDLIVPTDRAEEWSERLNQAAALFDGPTADVSDLRLAALEAGFFDVHATGVSTLTPAELQLRWRVDTAVRGPWSEALSQALDAPRGRITRLVGPPSASAPPPGSSIVCDGQRVGMLLHSSVSFLLERPIGLGLLDLPYAVAGLELAVADLPGWTTQAAPLLHNRSLFVDPQRHSWASRDSDSFPPIVPP